MKSYHSLSPIQFLGMIKAGAHHIIQNERKLNQLNVFPVTDHDTGTNLASLMRYVSTQFYPVEMLSQMMQQLREAFLYGASGNSGMIFSSFFSGFGSHAAFANEKEFTLPLFAECLKLGKENAYQAVEDPLEGTMLSIFNAWSTAYSPDITDFLVFFEKCTTVAKEALSKTEFQLSALKDNHVIDAGALGVQLFIQGMYEYLLSPEDFASIAQTTANEHIVEEHFITDEHEVESQFTYCMECIVHGENNALKELKPQLQKYGDSIVITQSGAQQKIHIHTNEPTPVSELLKKIGKIQYQKVDNMRLQWAVSHARKHPIAIVTDSAADIPHDIISNEQVHIIPLQVKIDDNNLLDNVTTSLKDIYKKMEEPGTKVSTASPSPLAVSRQLSFLLGKYQAIIVVTLSSKLSSTYQIIAHEAQKLHSPNIHVIDSLRNSAGQGLLVMSAIRLIAEGLAKDAIIKQLIDLRTRIKVFLVAGDMKSIARSGRIPEIVGALGSLSQIKPIITLNEIGKAAIAGVTIGETLSFKKVAKLMNQQNQVEAIKTVIVVHTDAEHKAKTFAAYLTEKTGLAVNYILETSAAIGLHLGKGCVAVALSPEEF